MPKSRKRGWRDIDPNLPITLGLGGDVRPTVPDYAPEANFGIPKAQRGLLRAALLGTQEVKDDHSSEGFLHDIIDRLDGLAEFANPEFGAGALNTATSLAELDAELERVREADPRIAHFLATITQTLHDAREAAQNDDVDTLWAMESCISISPGRNFTATISLNRPWRAISRSASPLPPTSRFSPCSNATLRRCGFRPRSPRT